MSVTTGSISAALLGVAGHAHRNWGSDFTVGGGLGSGGINALALLALQVGVSLCGFRAMPGVLPTPSPAQRRPACTSPCVCRPQVRAVGVRVLALVMMAISIGMAIYAAINFKRRGDMLV